MGTRLSSFLFFFRDLFNVWEFLLWFFFRWQLFLTICLCLRISLLNWWSFSYYCYYYCYCYCLLRGFIQLEFYDYIQPNILSISAFSALKGTLTVPFFIWISIRRLSLNCFFFFTSTNSDRKEWADGSPLKLSQFLSIFTAQWVFCALWLYDAYLASS